MKKKPESEADIAVANNTSTVLEKAEQPQLVEEVEIVIPEEKRNIWQKLLFIQSTVLGLSKNSKAYGYEYVSGHKVIGVIKPLMNKLGLILKQEIVSIQNERQDYTLLTRDNKLRNKSEILSRVMMRFTWIDCETGDKDENMFGANGQNDWDKGVGSALTYGERYFLCKYFHITTEEDILLDIDNPDRKEQGESAPVNVSISPGTGSGKSITEPTTEDKVAVMKNQPAPAPEPPNPAEVTPEILKAIKDAKVFADIVLVWNANPALHANQQFGEACTARKLELKAEEKAQTAEAPTA